LFRYRNLTVIFAFLLIPCLASAGTIQLGKPAITFSLADLHGKLVSLKDFKGKVIFIAFWASWCASCREELPALDKLYGKFAKEGFEVIGVNLDESDSAITHFLRKFPVTFTILRDKDNGVNDTYHVSGLPTSFLVGRDGVIYHIHKGFGTEFLPQYEKEIVDLLGK
jgi:peroxiredoxin